MITKIYRVTDLGPGDGGKGGVVQALARKVKAGLVIKEGGAQGSHGVAGTYGSFAFSQWGCGTFDRIPTYLSPNFVMSPIGLLNEANSLRMFEPSLEPFRLITANPKCLCATPYHQVWSRIHELKLKEHPHGTVGTGVGKAYFESKYQPYLSICARDLKNESLLRTKLEGSRQFLLGAYGNITAADVLPEDKELLEENLNLLLNDAALEDIIEKFLQVGQQLVLKNLPDILETSDEIAIIERSHGVLTDLSAGFSPHISNIRTLPSVSDQMLERAGYSGEIVNLAVHRAYEIRHGAGPIPTADDKLRNSLLPGSHKLNNRWQGEVRVGALDLELLDHALNTCGGAEKFDGLCITWFDQIIKNGEWQICTNYLLDGEVRPKDAKLTTEVLDQVKPIIISYDVPTLDKEALANWCQEILSKYIDLPVRLVSLGPKPEQKIFI